MVKVFGSDSGSETGETLRCVQLLLAWQFARGCYFPGCSFWAVRFGARLFFRRMRRFSGRSPLPRRVSRRLKKIREVWSHFLGCHRPP